jgi:hypothetical protein
MTSSNLESSYKNKNWKCLIDDGHYQLAIFARWREINSKSLPRNKVEFRFDHAGIFTKDQFIEYYGGEDEWNNADPVIDAAEFCEKDNALSLNLPKKIIHPYARMKAFSRGRKMKRKQPLNPLIVEHIKFALTNGSFDNFYSEDFIEFFNDCDNRIYALGNPNKVTCDCCNIGLDANWEIKPTSSSLWAICSNCFNNYIHTDIIDYDYDYDYDYDHCIDCGESCGAYICRWCKKD